MTTALERVNAAHAASVARRPRTGMARSAKSWSEPPFWALDSMRLPFMSSLPDREHIEHDFDGYARGAGKASAIVFSCFYARLRVYSQARFAWRERRNGQAGDLFTTAELAPLEKPWPTASTRDLLAWMEVDATFAGNSFWTWTDSAGRYGVQARGPSRRLTRMRPDWVWIVIDSASGDPYALDARIVAFIYDPRTAGGTSTGMGTKQPPVLLTPAEVCHYAPVPDPEARFRGMSWLTPVLREVSADRAATEHKVNFFRNGASLQTIISLDKDVPTPAFDEFVERFRAMHEGTDNAYKTLFVGGGADVTVTSANLQELDYKRVTGGTETRIAGAAGVHPVVVGLSEGLQGSSLNAGNYGAASRNFADGTLQDLWGATASSLGNLLIPPTAATELVVDTRDVPFLHEDKKDAAEIQKAEASTIRQLLDAGFEATSVIDAVRTNDWRRLRHSGLYSVQLQPPGTQTVEPAAVNGNKQLLPALMGEVW